MNNFAEIRQLVDIRQAAEMYGLEVNRSGMARCIFHADKNPSMKTYDDHFHCYACGAHGDVTDLTAQIFGISKSDAMQKLCADFGVSAVCNGRVGAVPKNGSTKRICASNTANTPIFKSLADNKKMQLAFDVLTDYIAMLRELREQYSPTVEDEEPDPRFTLSLQQLDYAEYLWDELSDSTEDERAEFINANISQFRRYYDSLKRFGKLRPALAEVKGGVRCVPPDSSEQTGNCLINGLSTKGVRYEYLLDGFRQNEKQLPVTTEINGRVKCVQPEERTEKYETKVG